MSGSVRLTGPTGALGIGLTNVRRTTGAYVDLDFAKGYYERGGVVRKNLTDVSGYSFTRASLATMFDSTGAMTYGPNNLLLQSQTFDNAAWTPNFVTVGSDVTTAPDGTATADRLLADAGNTTHYIFQAQTVTAGTRIFSCYAKYVSNQWFTVRTYDGATTCFATFDLLNGVVGTTSGATNSISSVGNGWYRLVMVVTMAAGTGDILLSLNNENTASLVSWNAAGTEAAYVWGAQLEAVTYQTTPSTYYPTTTAAYYGARLVYDPVTLASQGILVEEARTNLCLQSQTFGTTWTINSSSVTDNNVTAPDGTLTGDTLTALAATSAHYLFQYITVPAGACVFSLNVKYTNNRWFTVRLYNGSVIYFATFDLLNGVTGLADAGVTSAIAAAANGWYRVSVAVTFAAAGTGDVVLCLNNSNTLALSSWTATGTETTPIWGAQLEAGTGASSYIPTTTASVTRAADVPIETTALTYPLTIVTEFIRNWDAGAAQIVCQVDAGSDTDRAYASIDSSDLFAGTTSGSGASTVAGATVVGTAYKGAVRVATNDVQTARGGTLGTGDTSATNPANPTRIVIGGSNAAGSPLNGTISRIRIYNRALSDAQLQSLTS